MKGVLGMLKGRTRLETLENWTIGFIIFGGLMLAAGIALSAWQTQGLAAILAMMGALVSFLATAVLIFIWLVKEIVKKE